MEKEYLKYRFGFIAVKKEFVTPEQVTKALEVQSGKTESEGKHKRIGEILVDMGLISKYQVDEVLKEMSKENP